MTAADPRRGGSLVGRSGATRSAGRARGRAAGAAAAAATAATRGMRADEAEPWSEAGSWSVGVSWSSKMTIVYGISNDMY